MKKYSFLIGLLALSLQSYSQVYSEGFESPDLPIDSMWYGNDQVTDGDTIYSNGPLDFELNYNSSWNSFSGFSVSSWTDDTTAGYQNQYSAITAAGAGGSDQYSVCYVSDFSKNRVFADNPFLFETISVTNTTYVYYSILNGDSFAKPFGADTNAQGQIDGTNGEDWFLLTIFSLNQDSSRTGDSVNFYLADYRFANDQDDYIVDTWEQVDLTSLGAVYGLDFELHSSDTSGGFGMNTPSYFAVDMMNEGVLSIEENQLSKLNAYPNPAVDQLNLSTEPGELIEIYNLQGQRVMKYTANDNQTNLSVGHLTSGLYVVSGTFDGRTRQTKLVKQ